MPRADALGVVTGLKILIFMGVGGGGEGGLSFFLYESYQIYIRFWPLHRFCKRFYPLTKVEHVSGLQLKIGCFDNLKKLLSFI